MNSSKSTELFRNSLAKSEPKPEAVRPSQAIQSNKKVQNSKPKSNERELVESRPNKFNDVLKNKTRPERVDGDYARSESEASRTSESIGREVSRDSAPSAESWESSRADDSQQMAMRVFLSRMQSELGISSDDILEAFQGMSIENLMAAPEDSAKAFINKLGLTESQKPQALALYNEMLSVTAAVDMQSKLGQTGQKAQFEVLSPDEARIKELRQNINTMSDKFFMNGSFAKKAVSSEPMVQAAPQQVNMATDPKVFKADASGGQFGLQELGFQDSPTPSTADLEQLARQIKLEQMQAELAQTQKLAAQPVGSAQSAGPAMPIANQEDQMLMELSQKLNQLSSSADALVSPETQQQLNGLSGQNTNLGQAPGLGQQALKAYGQQSSQSESNLEDSANFEGEYVLPGEAGNQKTAETKGAQFMMKTPEVSTADNQGNVKEIISKAQFLATKGGGEMKVSLNPEGVGQVHLKVSTENGQVNVEMVTSSSDAKKVLEKGLVELKDNLATHKLHLDSIKIESGKDISNQLSDQRESLEQSFQEKFLNDFKDRNESMRRGFFDLGGPRVPASQTSEEAQAALEASAQKKKSERKLDLVA